jgi:hypothetical protein
LPRGHRVVLEVDGASRYTAPDSRPDAATHALL